MQGKNILLHIGPLRVSILEAVQAVLDNGYNQELQLIVITRQPKDSLIKLKKASPSFKVQIKSCGFQKNELKQIISPIAKQVIGVSCRSDKHIQDLRRVVELLPSDVYVSSTESLTKATNKALMRQAFYSSEPLITPKYINLKDDVHTSIKEIEVNIGYPVILKPANLASSLLIQSCFNRVELKTALNQIYSLIDTVYAQEERIDKPEVIAEEYLEGDFYSIDAYVLNPEEIYFCPPVAYIPAKQLGINDFFLYKRSLPTQLTKLQINKANQVVSQAIRAIGLSYVSAHVELVLTLKGWKVIELGPRIGRFRIKMYQLAYGIDHALNDIKIHLGLKPELTSKFINYCSAYSIYPKNEGRLKEIKGLKLLNNRQHVNWLKVYSKAGDYVKHAKNGGHSLAEFIISTNDKEDYLKLIKNIEDQIYAETY